MNLPQKGEAVSIKRLILKGFFVSSLVIGGAHAHTVSYKGANALMTANSSEMSNWTLNHSFTSRAAGAASYLRFQGEDAKREAYLVRGNFLLKRWNELASQGNLYFSLGQGILSKNDKQSGAGLYSEEADWESRKYYVAFMHEGLISYKSSNDQIYMTKVRAGFAPYLADFKELNAWAILEVKSVSKMKKDISITPIIRLFYNNVLMEFGVSSAGESEFNFMVHF